MDSIFTTFLLLLAAIVALFTYLVIQAIPATAIATAAVVLLAAGVWWHYTQFHVDYRTSTWQEQLRSYASYVILFVVILLSYAFYVFAAKGGSIQALAEQGRNAGRRVASQAANAAARGLSRASNATGAGTGAAAAASTEIGEAMVAPPIVPEAA